MKSLAKRLWPRSLAARLTLLMVAALAVAQLGLTVLLSTQRDSLVEDLMHSQSLNQTVTLARLLNAYPATDADRLTAAFGSRQSCAAVRDTAPATVQMSGQETQLAAALQSMLHGIDAGAPQVVFETAEGGPRDCGAPAAATTPRENADRADDDDTLPVGAREHRAALGIDVPLVDGRWLHVHTAVALPDRFDDATLLSFFLSALAVAVVAIVGVRSQTRSLRALADASDRFGRGEQVAQLPTRGPLEVSLATQAFNTMQERLSQFIRDRMRLLASISHDLRTPITTLRLKAEFIEDEAVREDLIATIDELTVICEATLAFTRSEATTEETRLIDLAEVVREVDEEFRLADKPVSEQRMDVARCACRPVALKRAIRNLVENAIRYGGAARTSVMLENGEAVIRIEDSGSGIPPERMAEAFEPFVRLEPSRSTETGGIGLGLAIARSIVNAHGGVLALSNLPDGGLRAEIRLPGAATARG